MKKRNKRASISTAQHTVVTALVILFFVGVIHVYYALLYSETRNSIIKSGELNASVSAGQIDKYLSLGTDCIRLVGYTLDNMIRDGRSQDEIRDYLINQSAAILNILSDDSTGLYGYINGEFLSGTDLVPDDGYTPAERPWYKKARANIGRVAVVDPYVDALSGTTIITLAKTLCDAKGVVCLDFSLKRLQALTEELAAQDNTDIEIILDQRYKVIAHSDKAEVGKNYLAESGTFGGTLVQALRFSDKSYFSFHFNDSFGHEAGDDYLRGCCKILCDFYKHSSIFRIGGDEFVAVLQGADYENRTTLAAQLQSAYEQAYTQKGKAAWERYSASAGTADREDGDTSLEQMLKRADKAMYEAKQAFKAKYGSYR